MPRIAITRITVVDSDGIKTSMKGNMILDHAELEEYRKKIIKEGTKIDHVIFNYEEVGDD